MKKIDTLTSLRFFMIMLIVLSHFEFLQRFKESALIYNLFFKNAYFAVDFFFILSGFGMMYSYIARGECAEHFSVNGCLSYAVRHVRKIYKLYAITMLLCIPLYCFYEVKARGIPLDDLLWVEIKKMAISIPLLQSSLGMKAYSHAFNGVAWFLSSIFCIYLVSPILLQWFRKIKSLKLASFFLTVCFLSIIVVRIFFSYIQENLFFDDLVYGSPYCRVFYVALGMLTAKFFVLSKDLFAPFLGNKIEFVMLALMLAFILFKNTFAGFYLFSLTQAYISILLVIGACFVFAFQNGFVSKLLQMKRVKRLGQMAMYIFLIHYPIRGYLDAIARFIGFKDVEWVGFLNVVITLILTFIFSSLVLNKEQVK